MTKKKQQEETTDLQHKNIVEQQEETTVSDKIKAVFEKHSHVLTVWVNEDQSVWLFREKPGFTPIERNEAL